MWDKIYEFRGLFVFPLGFFALWLGFLAVRKILWIRLGRVFERTPMEWDGVLLKALDRPVRYLLLFGALSVSMQWAPAAISDSLITHALSKIGIVAVLAWITDRALMVFLFHTEILRGLSTTLKNLLKVVLRMAIYSVVALIALESFGVSITPLLASLGVGSLAVALALQDTLGNLFSGFYLVLDRPIRMDDLIRLEDGTEGKVVNIGWRSTRIELGSGNTVILPNSKLSSSRIINYEIPNPEVTFSVNWNIAFETEVEKIQKLITEVAKECQTTVEGAVKSFQPVFLFQGISELGVGVAISLRAARMADTAKLRHEFIKRILVRLKAEGIELPLASSVKLSKV